MELCKTAAAFGGIYASHMRNESDRVVEAVAKPGRVAEKRVTALISHHKSRQTNWVDEGYIGRFSDAAKGGGRKSPCDQYRIKRSNSLLSALPPPMRRRRRIRRQARDAGIRNEIKALRARMPAFKCRIWYADTTVCWCCTPHYRRRRQTIADMPTCAR